MQTNEEKAFQEKYNLNDRQMRYVREFLEETGRTLEEAAEDLDLERVKRRNTRPTKFRRRVHIHV